MHFLKTQRHKKLMTYHTDKVIDIGESEENEAEE